MADDADVVRCAAPWPGTAAQLVEGFAVLGPGQWHCERVCDAGTAATLPGDAVAVLAGLAVAGVCVRSDDGEQWSTELSASELQRLAVLLRGAEQYRRMRREAPQLELVVTMPMPPSFLASELPSTPGRPGGYLSTTAAMQRIARAARSRLVAMTPFIDSYGFGWLRTMFDAAAPEVEKVLILRDSEKHTIAISVEQGGWLRAQKVSVRDYFLAHPVGGQRTLPLETFHAKIVLADNQLAYVGSANLLGSGDGTSLEAGVLVDGAAAGQVSRLIDGILRVARSL